MSSKREEEKNEKIIRGLMKLPPNRKCINCNSLGPQYVCTNFWTFVCITCSGIHREFTHRVKSVSMAKFTKSEVEALQNGGNQRAREVFLPDWDFQRTRLPDSSNPDRIRQFIKSVYVEKKYAGGRSSDKPPRNIQTQNSFEEDHRRASSYHSYSQSPPYDYQYEDRLYGKQSGMLTRKPGSDRGGSEKISSLIYSPGREDRFSNEISGPRLSDFSLSSTSDSLKDGPGGSDPQQVRDILIEDGRSRDHGRNLEGLRPPLRSVSLGSLGLFTEKSVISEGPQPIRNPRGETLISSNQPSISQQQPIQSSSLDFFAEPSFSSTSLFDAPKFQEITTPPIPKVESLDLFAEISHPSSNPHSEPLEKEGWASFDLPIPKPVLAEISNPSSNPKLEPISEKERWAAFDSPISKPVLAETNNPSSKPNSVSFLEKERWAAFDLPIPETVLESKPSSLFQESAQQNSGTSTSSQTWNAFDLSSFEMPQTASTDVRQQISSSFQKDFDKGVSIPSFDGAVGSSSLNPDVYSLGAQRHDLRSTNPFDIIYDSDPEPVKFLDMNPLQSTLPQVQYSPFHSQISQPSWSTYAAPVGPAGSFPFMAGQPSNSQPTEMQSHGPVSSLKGNPFE